MFSGPLTERTSAQCSTAPELLPHPYGKNRYFTSRAVRHRAGRRVGPRRRAAHARMSHRTV